MLKIPLKRDELLQLFNGGIEKMGRITDPRKNESACWDFTAFEAMINIEREKTRVYPIERRLLNRLLRSIFTLCDKAGYEVVGRITLRDKKTGKIYR